MSKILKISTVFSICALAMVFSPKVEAGIMDLAKSALSSVDPKAAKTEGIAILKRNKKNAALILLYRSKLKSYAAADQAKVTQFCDKFCNRLACGKTPTSDAKAVKGMKVVATVCFAMCNPSLTKACSAAAKDKFPDWMKKLESTRKKGKKIFEDLGKPTVPTVSELKKIIAGLKAKLKEVGITLPF